MNCPVCSNHLRTVRRGSVDIDTCDNCSGLWFDRGELEPFVKDFSDKNHVSAEETRFFRPRDVQGLEKLNEELRICPRCQNTMQKVDYCADSNIFIDRCPHCGGVWADYGETKRIARYLKNNPATIAYAKEYLDKDRQLTAWEDLADTCRVLGRRGYPFIFMPNIILPLSDEIPVEKPPIVTLSLIALCVFAFLTQVLFRLSSHAVFDTLGLVPAHFLGIGLFTSLFLHANIMHLLGNMLFLWIFGDNVESRFSRVGYIIFYLSCGLAAGALHSIFNINSNIPIIGASGAISGILGAYLFFYPSAVVKIFFIYRIIRVFAVVYIGGWFLLQVLYAFAFGLDNPNFTGVAWFAHVGGFIFGACVTFFKKRMSKLQNSDAGC